MDNIILDIPFRDESLCTIQLDEYENIISTSTASFSPEDIDRPLKATELFSKLRRKGWGKYDGRFMTENKDLREQYLMYRVYGPEVTSDQKTDFPEDPIDVISTCYTLDGEVKSSPFFRMWPEKYDPISDNNPGTRGDIYNKVHSLYISVFGEYLRSGMDLGEEIKSNPSCPGIRMDNKVLSFSLISPDSDCYTNTVDLGELIQYSCIPGLYAKVDLSVQYSVNRGGSWKVYCRDVSFTAFRYLEKTGLKINSLQEDLDSDVSVYFIAPEGIIEVHPQEGSDIEECIINSCSITYGKS